ncbi:hypothetical protein SPRG_00469 [Saprolegnia parasitica CBS 223.65]|uniref:Uncharacterized protein n=1 Tax=Saprolegnia parasitica (strain CBS 223.65) TaxID=695850 RepID=A0A067D2B1_SAPPC|nr:hypothetical protein SPRG_00469 [Saprolegnia parasitica CBS 223.65]KDO35625.1 hypothetical protein SPRG_00469 [Saprolegnia parasitica CBS 223.65]|eukprot:XP_012193953.1 hypothetical protein SPRG_00469 [Saprolegnia parasitica CBS 223.65]
MLQPNEVDCMVPTLIEERMRLHAMDANDQAATSLVLDPTWSDDEASDVYIPTAFFTSTSGLAMYCPPTTLEMLSTSDCTSEDEPTMGLSMYLEAFNLLSPRRGATKHRPLCTKKKTMIKKRKAGKASTKKTVKRSVQRAFL